MVLAVLKVPGEDIERNSNHKQKVFSQMRHGGLVVGSSIIELYPELLHME